MRRCSSFAARSGSTSMVYMRKRSELKISSLTLYFSMVCTGNDALRFDSRDMVAMAVCWSLRREHPRSVLSVYLYRASLLLLPLVCLKKCLKLVDSSSWVLLTYSCKIMEGQNFWVCRTRCTERPANCNNALLTLVTESTDGVNTE